MVVTAAAVGAIAAISSLGYGIYASQRAASTQAAQYSEQKQAAQQQQVQQQQMLQKQQDQQTALATQQSAQQTATQQANQQAQKDALSAAQAQIPVIQGQLSSSLAASQQQAMSQQEPLIEGRLNALGLLQSGALPAQQAQYQAQLASQAQQELANYGTTANTNIQNQALAYTGQNSQNLQADLQTTLANQQAALNQQFSGQDTAYQNNVAQQQYLSNLQAAQTAAAGAQANQFINLGGQLGAGALSYFGKQNAQASQPSPSSTGYGGVSYLTPTASNSGSYFDPLASSGSGQSSYFSSPSYGMSGGNSYGMFDASGNYIPQASALNYKPYTGGIN